ncbi:hypothetical protein [Haloparvum sedimenti]|uniref:hypothetical protein n=1 Tax=Haloparvum sedimenti TaxID=1678448 RepID=UPI00071E99DE|nr:hypothetical protein [Haloparvum sedimenti]
MSDYVNLRTIPAAVGIAFSVMSVYLFGGLEGLTIGWGINYTLTSTHALWGSMAAYVIAFASSETRAFDRYEMWEKVLIAAGPALMIGYVHVQQVTDFIHSSEPMLPIIAFFVSFASYGVLSQ